MEGDSYMAYIYQIINDVNQKIYVGKTEFSIEKRFKEHCSDAFKERNEKRPLYSAMRKYGIKHFHIELIEETNNPEEREKYWIKELDSYNNGYNATFGGDGKLLYNHQDIINALKINPRPIEIANLFNCSVDLVCLIAKENDIQIINRGQEQFQQKIKQVFQYDKQGNFLKQFNSVSDAGLWCFENKKCLNYNSGVRSHIADCANRKRKSAYGYIWKYN